LLPDFQETVVTREWINSGTRTEQPPIRDE